MVATASMLSDMIEAGRLTRAQPDGIPAMTQRYTTGPGAAHRLAPEQYFWLHRRWKHQPLPKKVRGTARPRFEPAEEFPFTHADVAGRGRVRKWTGSRGPSTFYQRGATLTR